MSWMQLLIAGLAAFRLTILISKDDGPGFIFWKLRQAPKPKSSLKEGISCPFCVSIWFAAPISAYELIHKPAWLTHCGDFFLLWMALSGIAIILNQAFTKD
jgi:sterol desaturase/sphingolipid hydroxylase (fatty acid hydroxylase superfamily)